MINSHEEPKQRRDAGAALPRAYSPNQEAAYRELRSAVASSPMVLLEGEAGFGKTHLIRRLVAETGGRRVSARDLFSASANGPHPALEGALMRILEDAMANHNLIAFDDFDLIGDIVNDWIGYGRRGLWSGGMLTLFERAHVEAKTLVFSGISFTHNWGAEADRLPLLSKRAPRIKMAALMPEDYAFHLGDVLDPALRPSADAHRIFEHAPKLNPYQLRALAGFLNAAGRSDDAFVRSTLDRHITSANVDLREVANMTFADLKGFEHIVEQLNIYVLNPLRGDARFSTMGLKPKRGVLLYGPPGTGKTSVGRALAHQMEGKFFMMDGAVAADPSTTFYRRVDEIFARAKRAAPSVVFIDDADVLFQSDRATGLTRYLLTMLDGLESETAGKVAVILTAMNPNHLPAALLRSGRVELWLETKAPAHDARARMVATYLKDAPDRFQGYDRDHAADLSEGFNAADMRRLVMDVKALYARDLLADREPTDVSHYFELAAAGIRNSRELLQLTIDGKLAEPVPIPSAN